MNVHRAIVGLAVAAAALLLTVAVMGQEGGFRGQNTVVTEGPDVTIRSLSSIRNDYDPENDVRAYAIGADSCNIGSEPVQWCNPEYTTVGGSCDPGTTEIDHPVMATNLYRLKNDRFEQIGASWLKHGFASQNANRTSCRGNDGAGNPVACQNVIAGRRLEVGCTDFYDAGTNGAQSLAPRSEVFDPAVAAYPTDYTRPHVPYLQGDGTPAPGNSTTYSRLQVHEDELAPALNPGARYWVEMHYLTPDDALAGNGLNNASHREVVFDAGFSMSWAVPGNYNQGEEETVREAAAIWAWKAVDPEVEIVRTDLPTDPVQRFQAARRVTDVGGATPWHVELVIHNLNSTRAARGLEIVFPPGTQFAGQGFHDVDQHSGSIWDDTDWVMTSDPGTGTIRWRTVADHATDPDGNALRYSTAYSFWFDTDQPPDRASWSLELFTPGTPSTVPLFPLFRDGFESGDTTAWN